MHKEIFNECVKKAIKLGRSWMKINEKAPYPTKEEWQLAIMLFNRELNKMEKNHGRS